MNLKSAVQTGLARVNEVQVYSRGGSFAVGAFGGAGFMQIPATSYDYKTAAAERYDNSIVFLALGWIVGKMAEPSMMLVKLKDDPEDGTDEWERVKPNEPGYVQGRAAIRAFNNPNPDYDGGILIFGICLSLITRGTAYLIKRYNPLGQVIGYRWIPNRQMRPRADRFNEDGTKLTTYFEYRPFGAADIKYLDPADVVVIRNGINPVAPAEGLAELEAALRSICTVNELETLEAAILHNMGIPGIMFVPKDVPRNTGASGLQLNTPAAPNADQRLRLQDMWSEFTRDRRGMPFAAPFPIDVHQMGLSPEQLLLDKIARLPVAIICGSVHIDPMVLNLPSETKTFSNYPEAREAAYEESIMPRGALILNQFSRQVLPAYGLDPDTYRLAFNWKTVRAIQPDVDKAQKRARDNWLAGGLTLNQFIEQIGMPKLPAGDLRGELRYTDLATPGLPGNEESGGDPKVGKPQPKADPAEAADAADAQAKKDKANRAKRKGVGDIESLVLDALRGELLQKMTDNRQVYEDIQLLSQEDDE